MSDISPRVHMVDWKQMTIEELKEYKMELGLSKHGDPGKVELTLVLMDFVRKMGEFMIAMGSGDHRDTLEAIADISNVGDILFGKMQDEYIQSLAEEDPECYADAEVFNTLECRSKICAWRDNCKSIVAADRAQMLREMTVSTKAIIDRDEHSTLQE